MAGLHAELMPDGAYVISPLVGGANQTVKFPLSNFLHLEDRESGTDNAQVEVVIVPSAISFPANKFVTEWQPINKMFRDIHVTEGATIRWEEKVLCRYRLRSNVQGDGRSKPTLLLEALILNTGTWAAVSDSKKKLLSLDSSTAIKLASMDAAWYSPIPSSRLTTAMGYMRASMEVPIPGELKYRWIMQAAMKKSDGGRSVESRQEFEAYIAMDTPYAVHSNKDIPFFLPHPFGGEISGATNQGRTVSFIRNGKVIVRNKGANSPPNPTFPPKFNQNPKGSTLSPTALPADTPQHLRDLAGRLFNASIARTTGKLHTTLASHVSHLEQELGRAIPFPLSPTDYNLLLTFLVSKKLNSNTVKSYMSGTKRMAMARGVQSPAPQPELSKTILKGYENLQRNPVKSVLSANHRPVSIHFLRLLGHACNKFWKGDDFDKLSFWVVCVLAFWGSFRIGELLGQSTSSFSPSSDLLGSDVLHMSRTSFALWIRDPKVSKQFGDVVEIWSTPHLPDIDPFNAFSTFYNIRQEKGFSTSSPLFMRARGDIFTAPQFNACLQALISHYSTELQLSTNRWTGHSFRSGLPTLLQSLGFSEDQIKSWGRWSSSAFQMYTKDMDRRMEVQRGILDVMARIKLHIE